MTEQPHYFCFPCPGCKAHGLRPVMNRDAVVCDECGFMEPGDQGSLFEEPEAA